MYLSNIQVEQAIYKLAEENSFYDELCKIKQNMSINLIRIGQLEEAESNIQVEQAIYKLLLLNYLYYLILLLYHKNL